MVVVIGRCCWSEMRLPHWCWYCCRSGQPVVGLGPTQCCSVFANGWLAAARELNFISRQWHVFLRFTTQRDYSSTDTTLKIFALGRILQSSTAVLTGSATRTCIICTCFVLYYCFVLYHRLLSSIVYRYFLFITKYELS